MNGDLDGFLDKDIGEEPLNVHDSEFGVASPNKSIKSETAISAMSVAPVRA